MAKTYFLSFGSNAQLNTGLSPTFITFISEGSTVMASPAITEVGSSTGLYKFAYTPSATFAVVFEADGGSTLDDGDRYITGVLDPISIIDQKLGDLPDSFGSTSVDPQTAIAYLKRIQEFLEGNQTFNKTTGVWDIYSRGSSTLLVEKTLDNSTSSTTKT